MMFPMIPTLADFFTGMTEKNHLKEAIENNNVHRCFVGRILSFTQTMMRKEQSNSIHNTIQFAVKTTNQIPFLDVLLTRKWDRCV